MTALRDTLQGALVMAPMTKGSNLPYRQLCQELGARVTMSEMVLARRLKQKRNREFALIRRAADEKFFGVQLAGNNPEEMAWATALVESRGADLVDVNLGCPIDYFTSKGLGAALARTPKRVHRIVAAMKQSAQRVPVTVKVRLGWNDEHRNYLDVAHAAIDGGADAITVHGRTRAARYTATADWNAIQELAAAVPVPVIGNGDVLFPHEIDAGLRTGCAAVMSARGVLIKPWLFREAIDGDLDPTGEERLLIYRRYVALAKAHWGGDEHGIARIREFLLWHLGFWCRYAPRHADGSYPAMQRRETWIPRSPLEALLARSDAAAHHYLADRLLAEAPIDVEAAPLASEPRGVDDDEAEAG